MKIDLHCHTKRIKDGESEERNVESKELIEHVVNSNVKVIAITNHNHFDIIQFNEILSMASDNFSVWPGIELDVDGINNDKGHVVLVNNPKSLEQFDETISDILQGKNPNNFSISSGELIELANKLDCLVIAHFYKSCALDGKSLEYIKKNITKPYRFFYEPSDYRTLGVLLNHDYSCIKGSDLKSWDEYVDYQFSELKLPIDSFEQFLCLAKKDLAVVDTLLNKKHKEEINISYSEDKVENVNIYTDVNIIFGTKGTGKSKTLEKIKKYFEGKGRRIKTYSPANTDDKISEKLEINNSERLLSNYQLDNCSTEFSFIKGWEEIDVTSIFDYIDHYKSSNKKSNKDKMLLLQTETIRDDNINLFNKAKNDLEDIEFILEKCDTLDVSKYLDENNVNVLRTVLDKLKLNIGKEVVIQYCEKISIEYTNKCITTYTNNADMNTETKTLPTSCKFYEFAKNRYKLEENIDLILRGFEYCVDKKYDVVGMLEENKELKVVTNISMLNKDSVTKEFVLGITILKNAFSSLTDIKKQCYSSTLNESISTYNELAIEHNIESLDNFLGVTKEFYLNNDVYYPSTGEATMIILQEALTDDYDVYILDEPEKSLGNSYVNDILVSRLIMLSKLNKVVVVATHNGNIAIRTYPYSSIYKQYRNGEYLTYMGNPFSNKMINVDDNNLILDWKEESLRVLEGGEAAFSERGEIYGK